MKHLFPFIFMALLAVACQQTVTEDVPQAPIEKAYTVSGMLDSLETPVVLYLKKRGESSLEVVDSFKTEDGSFTFEGKIASPEVRYLMIGEERNRLSFFLEGSEINIKGDGQAINEAKISGSATQDLYQSFLDGNKPFDEEFSALYERYKEAEKAEDEAGLKLIDEEWDAKDQEKNAFIAQFVRDNSNSVLAPYLAHRFLTMDPDMDMLDGLISGLSPEITSSNYGTEFTERVDLLKKVAVGQPATDFVQATPEGDSLALSELSGQYVLIDFWASWCGPCRAENPNVVKLYDEYHEKGFEILGVSFDTKEDRWLDAIEADSLTWPQVSDLEGWRNAAGQLYGVRAIPHTVLLDKNQKIIAKNLRGEELREKVASLLGGEQSGS